MSDVEVERAGRVGTIRLNNPGTLNSVDGPTLVAVAAAVDELAGDAGIRVIVVTGAGRGFCSGARLTPDANGDLRVDESLLTAAGRVISSIMSCDKPVLAAVNGIAAGVGLSIALACDYVVACDSATFMLAFGRIGLMPDGGATALVAASIGRARALRMALTAEKVPAHTAEQWGLICESCPDDLFTTRVADLADLLANGAPKAVAATKHAITGAVIPDLDAVLAREEAGQLALVATDDFAEGVSAFIAKRVANFTGS